MSESSQENKFFLPISKQEIKERGWNQVDIILISGDAYVDHPSYGTAVIGRVLESKGFKVAILAQPNWRSTQDFMKLGAPRLFFGITSGNVDSMVANYTANKRKRKTDDYSPGGKSGLRPDRALTVYANRIREAFSGIPIVLGGIEASLRRFAHYDYWEDHVRRSILLDTRADILVYGMGERQVLEIAERISRRFTEDPGKKDLSYLKGIPGTALILPETQDLTDFIELPSYERVLENKDDFNQAFRLAYGQMNPFTAKPVIQKHQNRFVVQYPPPKPLSPEELDKIYELPYTRVPHPSYQDLGGIKGIETVRFSIISHRGCAGECSFCSLFMHQGRIVQSRTEDSILSEARMVSGKKDFKGTLTDIGGPTANLYSASCPKWDKVGYCAYQSCLTPRKCKNLVLGYKQALTLYDKIASLPRVRHVFIGSGFRYDLVSDEENLPYLEALCKKHISGQIKVAPEHMSKKVLNLMNKPGMEVYEKFLRQFEIVKKKTGLKLFPVNYFIVGHPGTSLKEALDLALYLIGKRIHPEQVQDFIPLPLTVSGSLYHTGKHPLTGEEVYIPKEIIERRMQRALLQPDNPENRKFVTMALKRLQATHLLKKFYPSSPR